MPGIGMIWRLYKHMEKYFLQELSTGGKEMAVLYPSQEWCEEWKKAINDSKECAERGKNWGVDFNGSFIFELQPSGGLEKTVYVYMDGKGGKCLDCRIINDPSEVDAGFFVPGPY